MGGTVSLVADIETEAGRCLAGSLLPSRKGSGQARASAGPPPADLLPPGAGGGNGPRLCLPAPGRPPPGRPGQQAQVSRTAGSSASSHLRLHGARGSRSPQGPVEAGGVAVWLRCHLPCPWGGWAAQVCPQGPPHTASSHDPCTHPLGRGPGLPCWGPSGVHWLRRAWQAVGHSWRSENCPFAPQPACPSLGGQDQDPTLQLLGGGSMQRGSHSLPAI